MSAIASMMMGKAYDQQLDEEKNKKEIFILAQQLADMKKKANEVESGSKWMAKPRGLLERGKQIVGMNPELDEYDSLKQALVTPLARKVFGEKLFRLLH